MENSLEHSEVSIEPLDSNLYDKALVFLENIFTREQNIPKELIPLSSETQRWWCIRSGDEILGIAAAWMTNSEWHWGRFSIDEKLRGKGLGTKLVIKSFSDLFEHDTDEIVIDARDVAVKIILKLGGEVTGETGYFYEQAITPMIVRKNSFVY